MKLNTSFLLLVLSLALLSASCVSKKSFNALQAEKDDLAMKLAKLESDFASTKSTQQTEISSLKDANSNLSSQKQALDADLKKTKTEFDSKITQVQSSVDDKQKQLDELKGTINAAFADVEQAVSSSNARINEMENFLYLDLDDEVNFRSGSAAVDPNDTETLKTLADMLAKNPNVALIIEGHTDDKGVLSGKAYDDNWDLSVSRATAVVRKLIKMGVNPEQLIASGRSEYMPAADNTSADGRKQNRRTEAILVPNIGKLYRVYKDGGAK
jgi:chemotaxis protein MotB